MICGHRSDVEVHLVAWDLSSRGAPIDSRRSLGRICGVCVLELECLEPWLMDSDRSWIADRTSG